MSERISARYGLQAKMILSVVLLLTTLMLVTTYMSIRRDSQGIFEQMQKDGVALARSYALSAENAILVHAGLGRLTGEVSRTRGVDYLKIIDRDRRIIGHTDVTQIGRPDADPLCRKALMTPITAVEKGKTPLTQVDRGRDGGEVLKVVVPLVILDSVAGALEVGLEMTSITKAVQRTNNQSLIIALFALAFGVACVWLFARSLTRPIKSLVQAAERVATGDLDKEIAVTTRDEIGHLAASFNHMTARLRENVGNLKKANTQLEAHAATIEELREYTANILASITPGVITLDLMGRITTLNNAGASILRLSRDDVIGKTIDEVFTAGCRFRAALAEALLLEGEYHRRELSLSPGDGNDVLLLINAAHLHDRGAEPVGLAVTFEDVTEVRQLQRRIIDSEKLAAMGELVVGIAHEVRNPLGALRTCAQFLQDKLDRSDARHRFAQLIVRETDRLNQLVARLLDFARPAENDLQYEDVNDLVEKVTALAVLKADGQNVTLETEYAPGVPRILGDAKRLQQALLNILLNALDAMPGGGRCFVRTAFDKEAGAVTIELRDTGEGIPEHLLGKIFNPFFTTRGTGTGLGLAIVRQIIAEHSGTIEVRSEVGEGTCFEIRLPACVGPT